MDTFQQIIERLGFPIFVVLWFMWRDRQREKEQTVALKEHNRLLHKLVVVNTVIARTLDVPEEAMLSLNSSDGTGGGSNVG